MQRNLIPPPVYLALFIGLAFFINYQFPSWEIAIVYSIKITLAIGFLILGLIFDMGSILLFIQQRTSINPVRLNSVQSLVTTGCYRFSRNPMYLGVIFILTGTVIYLANVLNILLLPVLLLILTTMQIVPEERALENHFGEAYRKYKTKVRRWL